MTQIAPTSVDGDGEGDDVGRSDDNADRGDGHFVSVLVCVREAPPKERQCKFWHCPKRGGVETLAQIVCGSSSVNINHC